MGGDSVVTACSHVTLPAAKVRELAEEKLRGLVDCTCVADMERRCRLLILASKHATEVHVSVEDLEAIT